MVKRNVRTRTVHRLPAEGGFTLTELMVACLVGMCTLGAAVQVASGVQRGYTRQLDSSAYMEEANFALDWIEQTLRSAGSNPHDITVSNCPAAGTAFLPLRLDPDANGLDDDIRINADVGLPNALLGGDAGACTEADEDITIGFDAQARTITRQDNNIDQAPLPMSDSVITGLVFSYLDSNRVVTAVPADIAFVGVAVTAQATQMNVNTRAFDTVTLNSEVRLRSR